MHKESLKKTLGILKVILIYMHLFGCNSYFYSISTSVFQAHMWMYGIAQQMEETGFVFVNKSVSENWM